MHHPTYRIAHTTTFVTPVVEHWLEREIAQYVTGPEFAENVKLVDLILTYVMFFLLFFLLFLLLLLFFVRLLLLVLFN